MARETAVIQGKAYWAKLSTPDSMSDKYQIDVCNLSDVAIASLEKHGVQPKSRDDERGTFITARSKFDVPVINGDKEGMNGTLIGNGSDVKVKIGFNKDHPMVSQYGTSMYVNKVMVTNLVAYEEDTDFDTEGDEAPF